jgi:hypothetical protein
MTLHVSGSLPDHHQEFYTVRRYLYTLCICENRLLPGAGWNCSWYQADVTNCIKCTSADVQCRTPDDGQGGCPKHVESYYQINLELSVSVGFIHKEFVMMHGHSNLKKKKLLFCFIILE